MKLVLILGFIALSSALSISRQEVDNEWEKFKHEYRKNQYYANSNEEALRKQIFADTYDMIVRHNKEADQGLHTYRLGVNQFSDITDEEYRQMLTLDVSALEGQQTYDKKPYSIKAQLPESVDWRTKNVVTAVKNQGSCGSCFAFSTVDTIESAHAIKTGNLVTLSPQNVVDCMGNPSVCTQGSYMHLAFEFIIKEGGLDKEESYPYKGVYQNAATRPSPRAPPSPATPTSPPVMRKPSRRPLPLTAL